MLHGPPRVLTVRPSVFHAEAEILSRDFESGLLMVDGSIEILGPSGCSVSPQLMDKLLSAGGMSIKGCLLYTSPSPRDRQKSRMPSSA